MCDPEGIRRRPMIALTDHSNSSGSSTGQYLLFDIATQVTQGRIGQPTVQLKIEQGQPQHGTKQPPSKQGKAHGKQQQPERNSMGMISSCCGSGKDRKIEKESSKVIPRRTTSRLGGSRPRVGERNS